MPMKISLIVVHHSGLELTKNLLDSIEMIRSKENENFILKIWIINNSENESEQIELSAKCKNSYSSSITVLNVKNNGYFKSANIGIDLAKKWGAEVIVVANNDIVFANDIFAYLSKMQYNDRVMLIYPKLIDSDGINQNPREVNPVGPLRILLYYGYHRNYRMGKFFRLIYDKSTKKTFLKKKANRNSKNKKKNKIKEISLGVGACFILTNQYLDKIRKLPEDVFLFGEEAIIAEKIIISNGITVYDPHLKVIHKEHATVGKLSSFATWKLKKESSKIYLKSLLRIWLKKCMEGTHNKK